MKHTLQPLIFDTKGNSLEDGPGIRSVVFLKGCPLSCAWCHNPESQSVTQQLMYKAENCIGCNECIAACPKAALAKNAQDQKICIDRNKCDNCLECVAKCPSRALYPAGLHISFTDIMQKIIPSKAFFRISGGGVTLTGGEATLFMDYAQELFKSCHEQGIHTLLETSGMFDQRKFERILLPHTDMIYMDIKLIDSEEHRKWCGLGNRRILDNFIYFHNLAQNNSNFSLLPRTPLIPDITDTDENIQNLVNFYNRHNVTKAALLKNNPMWFNKCTRLGINSKFTQDSPLYHLYNLERFEKIKAFFEENGVKIIES